MCTVRISLNVSAVNVDGTLIRKYHSSYASVYWILVAIFEKIPLLYEEKFIFVSVMLSYSFRQISYFCLSGLLQNLNPNLYKGYLILAVILSI